MPLSLVIFDMDGLMLDTESVAVRAWIQAAKELGQVMTEADILSVAGTNDEETIRIFSRKFGLDFPVLAIHQRHNELKEGWADTEGVPVKSGLSEALIGLRALHIPMAVATSTRRERAEKLLRAVGVLEFFSGVVCGSDVKNSKPAPDIFIKACAEFSVSPENAVVLEDSAHGVTAAHNAGIPCVHIPDMVVLSEDTLSLTAAVLPSLSELVPWLKKRYSL